MTRYESEVAMMKRKLQTFVDDALWDWAERYRERKGLSDMAKAIRHMIEELQSIERFGAKLDSSANWIQLEGNCFRVNSIDSVLAIGDKSVIVLRSGKEIKLSMGPQEVMEEIKNKMI